MKCSLFSRETYVFLEVRKQEHVCSGQVKQASRGSVKQRPNPLDSAARTNVLGYIISYKRVYYIEII